MIFVQTIFLRDPNEKAIRKRDPTKRMQQIFDKKKKLFPEEKRGKRKELGSDEKNR